ncbi:MAG: hypothetical protein MUE44_19290 [Oscillatoriaceae cyanobacterium Prado104]|jgi:hypothetical protein|nr:hypothetical protein [Oscillatoriaceae cyanobacterium Prado104]
MLKFVDVSESLPESIEFDDYVPISIRWEERDSLASQNLMGRVPKLYWSIGDQYSLVEIGIDSQMKMIREITVVVAGLVTIQPSEFHINASLPAKLGRPIFQIDGDPSSIELAHGYYYRENGTFKLHVGSNHICVVFYNLEVVSQIVCGRVRFGLDLNNCLCMLEVVGFSAEEIAKLTDTLQYQRS